MMCICYALKQGKERLCVLFWTFWQEPQVSENIKTITRLVGGERPLSSHLILSWKYAFLKQLYTGLLVWLDPFAATFLYHQLFSTSTFNLNLSCSRCNISNSLCCSNVRPNVATSGSKLQQEGEILNNFHVQSKLSFQINYFITHIHIIMFCYFQQLFPSTSIQKLFWRTTKSSTLAILNLQST